MGEYERYIRKNGKIYGPYKYSNRKENGKVISEYHGRSLPVKKNYKKLQIGITVTLLVLSVLLLGLFSNSLFTGDVLVSMEKNYVPGEKITGSVKLNLDKNEFIPANTKVLIKYADESFRLTLGNLIGKDPILGDFYLEGKNISGQGLGFSSTEVTYPEVKFSIKILEEVKSNSEDVVENVTEEVSVEEVILEETPVAEIMEEEVLIEEPLVEEVIEEEPYVEEVATASLLTGQVVLEKTIIDGKVSFENPYYYNLSYGETAEIVSSDEKINLEIKDNMIIITTIFVEEKKIDGVLEIDLEDFDLSATVDSNLEIEFSYENISIAFVSESIEVLENVLRVINSTEILEKVSVNESIVNETIENEMINVSKNIEAIVNTTQYGAVVGFPVKWRKKIKTNSPTNLTIELPKEAEKISVSRVGENVSINRTESIKFGITGNVVTNKRGFLSKFYSRITGNVVSVNEKMTSVEVVIEENATEFEIEYETPGPVSFEDVTPSGKKIIISSDIHYKNILAFTEIPRATEYDSLRLYHYIDGVKVLSEFQAYDSDGKLIKGSVVEVILGEETNNTILYGEGENATDKNLTIKEIVNSTRIVLDKSLVSFITWTVPHLSNQTYELVIKISKAEHLDSSRAFLEDVYTIVSEQDNLSIEIPEGDYLRVTFEMPLNNKRDITVYAKGNGSIEIFKKDSDSIVETILNITKEKYYKVYLKNLIGEESVFDLKILGNLSIDHVIDPEFPPVIGFNPTTVEDGAKLDRDSFNVSVSLSDESQVLGFVDLDKTVRLWHSFNSRLGNVFLDKLGLNDITSFEGVSVEGVSGDGVHLNNKERFEINDYGDLSEGEGISFSLSMNLGNMSPVKNLYGGGLNYCFTLEDGRDFCQGYNSQGQLGSGGGGTEYYPREIAGDYDFKYISVGYMGSCGLLENGNVMCWGYSAHGSIGETSEPIWVPTLIGGGFVFKEVSMGSYSVCGLLENGSAMCWGENDYGQLGSNTTIDTHEPTLISGDYNFSSIYSGQHHACGILIDGSAMCWGRNQYGQLGNGETVSSLIPAVVSGGNKFKVISLAEYFTCGLLDDGSAMCWGRGDAGRLGDSYTSNRNVPTVVSGSNKFKSLSLGAEHSCGVTEDGSGYCWGVNTYSTLGEGTTTSRLVPTPIYGNYKYLNISSSGEFTCGLLENRDIKCWGRNSGGSKGMGASEARYIPRFIAGDDEFKDVSAGSSFTCGLLENGTAMCWGRNSYGQLGDRSLQDRALPTEVDGGYNFKKISSGDAHTCGILENGNMMCWGRNFYGQLGFGNYGDKFSPILIEGNYKFKDVSAGDSFTCGLLENGTAMCWGRNSYGQLGNGEVGSNSLIPSVVSGDNKFKSIYSTSYGVCGVLENGEGLCWGRNNYGQLGDGTNVRKLVPTSVHGDYDFKKVETGTYFSCGLTEDGRVFCWGYNLYGRLGNGGFAESWIPVSVSGENKFKDISLGHDHACGILEDDTAMCWGMGTSGQLGDNDISHRNVPVLVYGGEKFKSLSLAYHSCGIVLGLDKIKCWGANNYGRLGEGDSRANVPTSVFRGILMHKKDLSLILGVDFVGNLISVVRGVSMNTPLSEGWNQIVLSNGEKNKLYINGVLEEEIPYKLKIEKELSDLEIGGGLNVTIDELMFFNRELSESEVSGLNFGVNRDLNVSFSGVSQGAHEFRAYAYDNYGASAITGKREVFVDSVKPVVNYSEGTLDGGEIVSQNYIFVNMTIVEANNYEVTFSLYNNTGVVRTQVLSGVNLYNFTSLTEDVYYYNVSVVDEFGNSGYSGTRNITLDTGAPVVNFVVPTPDNNARLIIDEFQVNVSIGEIGKTFGFVDVDEKAAFWLRMNGNSVVDELGKVELESNGGEVEKGVLNLEVGESLVVKDNEVLNSSDKVAISLWFKKNEMSKVKEVRGGAYHSCVLLDDGSVLCWGQNADGQLGDGTNIDSGVPTKVSGNYNFLTLSLGRYNSCGILINGSAMCWGTGVWGILGYGGTQNKNIPTSVSGEYNFTSISVGRGYTCGVLVNKTALCWGRGLNGELGDGAQDDNIVPNPVSGNYSFVQVSAGITDTCGILTNGSALCWGRGGDGQLGDGLGIGSDIPVFVSGNYNFTQISTSLQHTCGILTNGSAMCWGRGWDGRLGNGASDEHVPILVVGSHIFAQISIGGDHSCGLLTNGTAMCWGTADEGILGGESTVRKSVPTVVYGNHNFTFISAGEAHTCGITENNSVYCWGLNDRNQIGTNINTKTYLPTTVIGNYNFTTISSGGAHACGLLENGSVMCFGRNKVGDLGDGTTIAKNIPTLVSGNHNFSKISMGSRSSCGILTSGEARCWGEAWHGRIGIGAWISQTSPYPVSGNHNFTQVAIGYMHGCGILINGSAMCWGWGYSGELGDGLISASDVPVFVSGNYNFTDISVGYYFSCGILTNGSAMCWGRGDNGRLGDNTTSNKNIPTPVFGNYKFKDISSTDEHSCGILTDGEIRCWGRNDEGQLGDGTNVNKLIPTSVSGDYIFESISVGSYNSCGILANGSAMCWGVNIYGQLGNGDTSNKNIPTSVSGDYVFKSISVGESFTCGIISDNSMKCWGTNTYGQLGIGLMTSLIPREVIRGVVIEKSSDSYSIGVGFSGNLITTIKNNRILTSLNEGWNHIVLSHKKSTQVYVNGVLSVESSYNLDIENSVGDIIIGGGLNMSIKNIVLLNRELSLAEVLGLTPMYRNNYLVDLVLGEGVHNYKMYIVDAAGNLGVSSIRSLSIDTKGPEMTVVSPKISEPILTNPAGIEFRISMEDQNDVTSCIYNLDSIGNLSMNKINSSLFNVTFEKLEKENHKLDVYCVDDLGNWNNQEFDFFVNVLAEISLSSIDEVDTTDIFNVKGVIVGNEGINLSRILYMVSVGDQIISSNFSEFLDFYVGSSSNLIANEDLSLDLNKQSLVKTYEDNYAVDKFSVDSFEYSNIGFERPRGVILSWNALTNPIGSVTYKFESPTKFKSLNVEVETGVAELSGAETSLWYSFDNSNWNLLSSTNSSSDTMSETIPVDLKKEVYVKIMSDTHSFTGENPVTNFKVDYVDYNYAEQGEYISDVFVLPAVTYTSISWDESLNEGSVVFQVRESSNSIDWGNWSSDLTNNVASDISFLKENFIQYRVLMNAVNPIQTPVVDSVKIYYFNERTDVVGNYDYNFSMPLRELGTMPLKVSTSSKAKGVSGQVEKMITVYARTNISAVISRSYLGSFATYSVNMNYSREDLNELVAGDIVVNFSNGTNTYTKGCFGFSECNLSWDVDSEIPAGEYNITLTGSNVSAYYRNSILEYTDIVQGKTTSGNLSLENIEITDFSAGNDYLLYSNATIKNTGFGTMTNVHVYDYLPARSFGIKSIVEENICEEILPGESCNITMFIIVDGNANVGEGNPHLISWRANWTDNDGSSTGGEEYISYPGMNIVIKGNSTIATSVNTANIKVQHGRNVITSFDVKSVGSTDVTGSLVNFTEGNVSVDTYTLPEEWVNLSLGNIGLLPAGFSVENVINVSVPSQTAPGNYTSIVNVTSVNGGYSEVVLNVEVPINGTWYFTPSQDDYYNKNFSLNAPGEIANYTLVNLGNINISFDVDYSSTGETNYEGFGNILFQENFEYQEVSYNPTVFTVAKGESKTIRLYQKGIGNSLNDIGVAVIFSSVDAAPSSASVKDTFNIEEQPAEITGIWFMQDGEYKDLIEVSKSMVIKIKTEDDAGINRSSARIFVTSPSGKIEYIPTDLGSSFGEYTKRGIKYLVLNYTLDYTPTLVGNYSVYAEVQDETGKKTTSADFTFDVIGVTDFSLEQSIDSVDLEKIDKYHSEEFVPKYSIQNIGEVMAYNITLNFSGDSSISVEANSFEATESLGYLSYTPVVSVSEMTLPGSYNLTADLRWINPDGSQSKVSKDLTINVLENKSFELLPETKEIQIISGVENMTTIVIENTGNANINIMNLECITEDICDNFGFTFSEIIFPLDFNETKVISVLVRQEGMYGQEYFGKVRVSTEFKERNFTLGLKVPGNYTWRVSPLEIEATRGIDSNGVLDILEIQNLGNVDLAFDLTSLNESIVTMDYSSIDVKKGETFLVPINYVAPSIEGEYPVSLKVSPKFESEEKTILIDFSATDVNVEVLSPTNVTVFDRVLPGDVLKVRVRAAYGNEVIKEDSNWDILIDKTPCSELITTFDNETGVWEFDCVAPNLEDGIVYPLTAIINHAEYGIVSGVAENSVEYLDTTAPTFEVLRENIELGENVNLKTRVFDNVNIKKVSFIMIYPNGTNYSDDMIFSNGLYRFNSLIAPLPGEYLVDYTAEDFVGNENTTTNWFEVYDRYIWKVKDVNYDLTPEKDINFKFYRPNTTELLFEGVTDDIGEKEFDVNKRFYDVKVTLNKDNILIKNLNFTDAKANNISLNFYEMEGESLTEIIQLYRPFTGIASNSTGIQSSQIRVEFNYSGYNYDVSSKLGIVKCHNWSYKNRACFGAWEILGSQRNIDEIKVTAESIGSSAYFLAENRCGNGACETTYGETDATCSDDCYRAKTVVINNPSSGGGGGGGSSRSSSGLKSKDLEKIEQIIAEFSNIGGVKLETTEIYKELFSGDTTTIRIKVSNTLSVDNVVELTAVDDIKNLTFFESSRIELGPRESKDIVIKIVAPKYANPGDYNGEIRMTSGNKSGGIPVTIKILVPEGRLLDVKIQPLTESVAPGEVLRLQVDLLNLGKTKRVDVQFDLQLIDLKTGEIVTRVEEAFAVETTISTIKNFTVPADVVSGKYMIKGTAYYSNKELDSDMQASSIAYIKIQKDFLNRKLFGVVPVWSLLLGALIILILTGAYFYLRWLESKRKRFKGKVNLRKLPQASKEAIFVGKIAEFGARAFMDLNALKRHILIAGQTGSGKTVAAQDIVEGALLKNKSVIVFDPTAQWSGLLKKCEDKKMLSRYGYFDMKHKQAQPFKGIIKIIKDPYELIDLQKYMDKPGEVTILDVSQLTPKEIDIVVVSAIQQVFKSSPDESSNLKTMFVFDEVHRLLPKFGGSGEGFIQIERACREFRKWGIGMMLISQVISDFVGEVKANIGTEIQMGTRYEGDLDRIGAKYGEDILKSVVKEPAGTGMVINPEYNEGRPYFLAFRPLLHGTKKLSKTELGSYAKYFEVIDDLEFQMEELEKLGLDILDLKLELKMTKDKTQSGKFRMVEMYLESLLPKFEEAWAKMSKPQIHLEKKRIAKSELASGLMEAKAARENYIKDNPEGDISPKERFVKLKGLIEDAKKKGKKTLTFEMKFREIYEKLKSFNGKMNSNDVIMINSEMDKLKFELEKI